MDFVKINDSNSLIRDLHSKAILETNNQALIRYQQQQKLFEQRNKQLTEIDTLKQEVSDIKDILKIILEKLT